MHDLKKFVLDHAKDRIFFYQEALTGINQEKARCVQQQPIRQSSTLPDILEAILHPIFSGCFNFVS